MNIDLDKVRDDLTKLDTETRGVDDALLGALKGDTDPAIIDALSRRAHENRASDAAKSDALRQAGIPGVRYLDQGSRGVGEGTHNYAMFDPSIVEILRKYGILPPLAGAGALGFSQNQ